MGNPSNSTQAVSTDVVVIGAGPAGLFSAFQCGMMGLSCHVVDALDGLGGQLAALYPEKPIYDIPGYPEVLAGELISMLEAQAQPFGPVYHLGQQVEELSQTANGRWRLVTSKGQAFDAGAVIIAAGIGAFGPNRPPIDGIEAFEGMGVGRGVHYFVSKREHFRDKRVVIAGGGDSAVDWAVSLSEVAASVAVVHRRPKFRAVAETVKQMEQLAADGRIEIVVPYQLDYLEGNDQKLDAVVVADLDGSTRRLEADVLLPFYGLKQNLGPILDWGMDLDNHHITVDPADMGAGLPGLYAAGDICTYPGKLKLILTGFSEAAVAAHAAHAHLHPGEELHFEYSTSKGVPGGAT